jgi:hypothetical protein
MELERFVNIGLHSCLAIRGRVLVYLTCRSIDPGRTASS